MTTITTPEPELSQRLPALIAKARQVSDAATAKIPPLEQQLEAARQELSAADRDIRRLEQFRLGKVQYTEDVAALVEKFDTTQ